MRRYKDPKGGLEIDMQESTQSQRYSKRRESQANNVQQNIPCDKVVETAWSYQLPMFGGSPSGGQECLICGTKTSYDNRWICVECWKKYNKDFEDGIKNAVSDVEIQIQ